MRRTTTAWIAGTLGAGLTASIVLAQQLPSSSSSRAGASVAGSSTPKKTPSLYGAAGARGAVPDAERAGLPQLPAIRAGTQVPARGRGQPEGADRSRDCHAERRDRARPERDAGGGGRGAPYALERAVATPQWIHRGPAGDRRRAAVRPGRPVARRRGPTVPSCPASTMTPAIRSG